MEYKTYQETFVDFVKKLDFDEINLLIYIAKLAVIRNSRNVNQEFLL